MRSNAWQITAIIAIILVVLLIIPLVIMGRDRQTLSDNEKQAREEQRTTAQKAASLEGDVRTLKALLGKPDVESLDELRKLHADIMGRAMPGENDSTRTYHDALTALLSDLASERGAHKATQDRYAQLGSDFNNAKTSHEAVVTGVRTELRRVEGERDAERQNFLLEKGNYNRQLQSAQDQQNVTLAKAERTRHELTDRANQLEISNRDISDTNRNLASLLEDVRNPNVEHPAAKIISIDQQAGVANINVGRDDGLLVRTMFSVYHRSITGLSFRTAPVGEEAVYCDVCKRDIARDVSKASVEVTRILGPHRAEVRILDDILTDPIMVGDVVYSPIWKPGQRRRFALTAGMHLPGSGIDSGTEAIKRLIEMNGGVVDAWIDENVPVGEDHLQGSITDLTNFIVVSDKGARGELDPEVTLVQESLLADGRNRAIKVISLEDLLSQMGWRNVTPVDVFGKLDFMPDIMRVVPQHQGTVRQSSGVVSPAYTPDNAAARLNARDASPVRTSPGIVSPLFNDATPPPVSSGRTSDLFRPRSPVAGRN